MGSLSWLYSPLPVSQPAPPPKILFICLKNPLPNPNKIIPGPFLEFKRRI